MANIYGTTSPIIYKSDGTAIQLPKMSRSGRDDDFIKIEKSWIDLDKTIQTRTKGFRLKCTYRWDHLENTDIYSLIDINNDSGILQLKFSTLPVRYPVKVSGFKHGLADGLIFSDAAEITFEGRQVINRYPDPDSMYSMPPFLGRGMVVIILAEQ